MLPSAAAVMGLTLGLALSSLPAFVSVAGASTRSAVTIETEKPFGPAPGSFAASGTISDEGAFSNVSRKVGAIGAPTFLVNVLVQRFDGERGSFTLRVVIKETQSADSGVLTGEGTWVVLSGTGAYSALGGRGTVSGTADDNTGVITRVYTGTVQLN